MSEAELYVLKARLRGGLLNKARRGALELTLPIGFVYDDRKRIVFDPDRQVQQAIQLIFSTFARTGAALATVKALRSQGLPFPRRPRSGSHAGEVLWDQLGHSRVLQILHNPCYAGVYVFGRTRTRKRVDGSITITPLAREDWQVVLPDAHPGYITWETYLENQQRLKENARGQTGQRHGPPREGPALLQGIVLCGRCGRRMSIRYQQEATGLMPIYLCQREGIEQGCPICTSLPGRAIDRAVGDLVVTALTPAAIQSALAVQQELHAQATAADRARNTQIERAQYEVDLARRRYVRVDPDNRLVADTLEAEWNTALRTLAEVRDAVEQARQHDLQVLTAQDQENLLDLTQDVPRVWHDPRTPMREKKRLLRLLVEDVTLQREEEEIAVQVRFRGGATRTLHLPLPRLISALHKTAPEIITRIDHLLEDQHEHAVAMQLNAEGHVSSFGVPFTAIIIHGLCKSHGLRSHRARLRARGFLTTEELATRLQVSICTIKIWRVKGLLHGYPYSRNKYLYAPPDAETPTKQQGISYAKRLLAAGNFLSQDTNEV